MRSFRPYISGVLLCVIVFSWLLYHLVSTGASANHIRAGVNQPGVPQQLQLDSRLPIQTFSQHSTFNDVNAKFGSRLTLSYLPAAIPCKAAPVASTTTMPPAISLA
ncbi:MAG TPA: hypothetical protein VJ761_19955 [Ktedonobacteraceae bacterium]|nr:hypothetical protein [Ktedonobacteraceae bacterium]